MGSSTRSNCWGVTVLTLKLPLIWVSHDFSAFSTYHTLHTELLHRGGHPPCTDRWLLFWTVLMEAISLKSSNGPRIDSPLSSGANYKDNRCPRQVNTGNNLSHASHCTTDNILWQETCHIQCILHIKNTFTPTSFTDSWKLSQQEKKKIFKTKLSIYIRQNLPEIQTNKLLSIWMNTSNHFSPIGQYSGQNEIFITFQTWKILKKFYHWKVPTRLHF